MSGCGMWLRSVCVLVVILQLVIMSHQTPTGSRLDNIFLEKAFQQMVNQSPGSSSSSSSSQWTREDSKRAADDLASFWKRSYPGQQDSFWKRSGIDGFGNDAFWKRAAGGSDTSAFWKRAGRDLDSASFWKRIVDPDMEALMRALETIRAYIERQRKMSNRKNHEKPAQKIATGKGASYEVIDENTNAGEIAADAHKEERRRGDEQIQPEFNPTGW